MENTQTFIVDIDNNGLRLDKFLANVLPEFSRNEIQKFDVKKLVQDQEVATKFSEKVKAGDVFLVDIPDALAGEIEIVPEEAFDLDILFEDDDVIVVNKPRGVVMYPAPGNLTGTLVQTILSHTQLATAGGGLRPGVVHRLDKDTSGVVILAKSDAAYKELTKTFATHSLTRKYSAFVWGVPSWESADISGNIARSTRNRQKMTMVKTGGKHAETEVEVENVWAREKISEFRCTLKTGRTHQIRVHLSTHGFPVLCDPIYGRGATRLGSVRSHELLEFLKGRVGQMLHAKILELAHPITGEMLKFNTKLPFDMLELRDLLDETL